ncbi:RNA binding protein [Phyllosticta capitalensis]|uniref:RNA binding protein n=1 Tax=Phyllosticta capitalensis TaxID=121624 RepID=A0ABR1YJA8_9PEZI
MDRALDDVISDRQRPGPRRGRRGRPADDYPRDGSSQRDDSRNLERDWVHDRFEDDDSRHASRNRGFRSDRLSSRRSPEYERESGYKIRVENLHYELTEDDICELFERIGPVDNARLMYDRHDRSEGVAIVTYRSLADARVACREYDGANAHGQPIRLTLVPPGPAPRRNPFDSAQRPSRSLFDRIESRDRSLSPEAGGRRSDVTKPPPAGIDRYVPGQDSGRRRSPAPRRRGGGGRDSGRRPGERRTGGPRRPRADDDGRPMIQGRPRKTQDELDAEMEDYWGVGHDGAADVPVNGAGEAQVQGATTTNAMNDDIDMEVE